MASICNPEKESENLAGLLKKAQNIVNDVAGTRAFKWPLKYEERFPKLNESAGVLVNDTNA